MIPGVRLVRECGALSLLILACILSATALADDTLAQPQALQYPLAVAVGVDNAVYVGDSATQEIYRLEENQPPVDARSSATTTLAASGRWIPMAMLNHL
jgi:outer membrane protein assembly factor BamB